MCHIRRMCSKEHLFPTPSHWTVSRDIDQFPSPLDNSHQPSKHALLIFTHLKVIKPSNQQTFSWPCNPLQVHPHFSAPLHGRILWKSLVFLVSFSSMLSPLSPLWWDFLPHHPTERTLIKVTNVALSKLIRCSCFIFWQHWRSLTEPSFPVRLLLQGSVSHSLGLP